MPEIKRPCDLVQGILDAGDQLRHHDSSRGHDNDIYLKKAMPADEVATTGRQ
jgi:hypothetical protein